MLKPLLVAIALVSTASPALAQTAEKDVLAALDRIFVAMSARDTAASRALLLPNAYFYSTVEGRTRTQSDTAYLSSLARGTDKLLERVYHPEVKIHNDIATVWARYDFFVNDKRSHCGVDSFTFIKTAAGWQMANVTYTVERTGCP